MKLAGSVVEVGDDVLELGTPLEEDKEVGGFLEVEYCYAGFENLAWRERKERKDVHGCVEVVSQDNLPAGARGFGFEVNDLAVG